MNQLIKNTLYLYFLLTFFFLLFYSLYFFNKYELFIVNFSLSLLYYILLFLYYNYNNCNYNYILTLILITFFFQLISVTALTQIYINKFGRPFSFTASDSLSYDLISREYLHLTFYETVVKYFTELPIDDVGFPTFLSLIYRISANPLLSRYVIIIFICLSTFIFYRVSLFYLSKKYSLISSMAFSLSNYTTLYASNGLKEHLMILIFLISLYLFLVYININKNKYLFWSILLSSLLLFFRIPVVFFLLITISITVLFKNKRNSILMLITFISIISSIYILYSYFTNEITRFTELTGEETLEKTSFFVNKSGLFTLLTAIISGLIGPFPTLIPKPGKEDVFFIGSALLFRNLLGLHIITTIIVSIKNKFLIFYPIILYPLITIISLISISQVFEFRFHIVHFPLFIILGFYSMENKLVTSKSFIMYYVFVIVLIIYWNIGRI